MFLNLRRGDIFFEYEFFDNRVDLLDLLEKISRLDWKFNFNFYRGDIFWNILNLRKTDISNNFFFHE